MDQLVDEYASLVRRIAISMASRMPDSVHVDDCIQDGMIGLLDAIKMYVGPYDQRFKSYASQRIRGAILDSLRAADWVPRSYRKKIRKVERAKDMLAHKIGRNPSYYEISQDIGIHPEDCISAIRDSFFAQPVYYDEFQDDNEDSFLDNLCYYHNDVPFDSLSEKRINAQLAAAIESLEPRDQAIIKMHYEDDIAMCAIASELCISGARAGQLRKRAITRLKENLFG